MKDSPVQMTVQSRLIATELLFIFSHFSLIHAHYRLCENTRNVFSFGTLFTSKKSFIAVTCAALFIQHFTLLASLQMSCRGKREAIELKVEFKIILQLICSTQITRAPLVCPLAMTCFIGAPTTWAKMFGSNFEGNETLLRIRSNSYVLHTYLLQDAHCRQLLAQSQREKQDVLLGLFNKRWRTLLPSLFFLVLHGM